MMKPTVDIVKDLVSQLTFTEKIISCVVVNGEVFITVCSTHGLVNKGIFFIGGVETKILRVIDGNTIVITGNACPVETEIFIPAPNYFHGTVKASDSQLTNITQGRKKTPMVYLYEVLKEVKTRNPEAVVFREVDIILFFLEDDLVKGDLTEDRYVKYISPMNTLAEDFVTLLEQSPIIASIEEDNYTTTPHAKAGYYDKLGHVKNIFSMELSGVELRIKLPIKRIGCEDCK